MDGTIRSTIPTPLLNHNGADPEGYNVSPSGTLISGRDRLRKYLLITNDSDTTIYLALDDKEDGETCPAVVHRGIPLRSGGSYEINNTNIYFGQVWAIHNGSGGKLVCVQKGR